jgi:CheY-like chemotaxis protein
LRLERPRELFRIGEAFKEKINILMVDDLPSRLLMYRNIFGGLGENLVEAHSGGEALECLFETEIAVIIADINMPFLGGAQLPDLIREHPRLENIGIILISQAPIIDTSRLSTCAYSAVDYIAPPIIPELPRAKVRILAELYRKARELKALHGEMRRLSGGITTALDEERRRVARERAEYGSASFRARGE